MQRKLDDIKRENERNTKSNKQKKNKTDKQEINVEDYIKMRFSDYTDIGLRIPVKYNVFGSMKSESLKLIRNLLLKNMEYLSNNLLFIRNINSYNLPWKMKKNLFIDNLRFSKLFNSNSRQKQILTNEEKIDFFLKTITSKKSCFVKDNPNDKCTEIKHKEFYVYKDPREKEYYFVFNLSLLFERYRVYSIEYELQILNFIELRTHIYDNVNLTKYKYKSARFSDGVRAEFFNLSDKTNMHMITNQSYFPPNASKKIPCIYRFYFKTNTDFGEFSRINIHNINPEHIDKLSVNKPKNMVLFAIPNNIRYNSPYKSNKNVK
jgi:hypothetical protein